MFEIDTIYKLNIKYKNINININNNKLRSWSSSYVIVSYNSKYTHTQYIIVSLTKKKADLAQWLLVI